MDKLSPDDQALALSGARRQQINALGAVVLMQEAFRDARGSISPENLAQITGWSVFSVKGILCSEQWDSLVMDSCRHRVSSLMVRVFDKLAERVEATGKGEMSTRDLISAGKLMGETVRALTAAADVPEKLDAQQKAMDVAALAITLGNKKMLAKAVSELEPKKDTKR